MNALWFNFYLAYRNISRYRRRSIITIGAIAFGITALTLAGGFINWMLFEFRETTIKSQLGHLQIVRPGYHDMGKANPYAFLLPDTIPDFIANEMQSQQIQAIVPRLSFSGLISYKDATLSFIGDGVDYREQETFGNALKIIAGKNISIDNPLGIIVGRGLAQNLGVNIGNQIVLLTNTASGGINAMELTINGIFSTVTKSYDDNALRVPINIARKLQRTKGSHKWIILLNDTSQTELVMKTFQNKLTPEDKEFEIVPWYKLSDFYNKTVVIFTKQILGVKIIISLIILLSIYNTMTINVIERIGEIGTAMALGLNRSGILQLFLAEGILYGCIGGIAGLIIGFLLANIISNIGIPMPPPPGMAHGYIGKILVTWNAAVESLLLAVFTTLVASVYPALKASRMQIVNALRYNR